MAEPTQQHLNFAYDYPRVTSGQLKAVELQAFFGMASDKPYYRLKSECEAMGIIEDEPDWTDLTPDELNYPLYVLSGQQDIGSVDELKETLRDLHRMVSVVRGLYKPSPTEKKNLTDALHTLSTLINSSGSLEELRLKAWNKLSFYFYVMSVVLHQGAK